jgi:hypothetical protein
MQFLPISGDIDLECFEGNGRKEVDDPRIADEVPTSVCGPDSSVVEPMIQQAFGLSRLPLSYSSLRASLCGDGVGSLASPKSLAETLSQNGSWHFCFAIWPRCELIFLCLPPLNN